MNAIVVGSTLVIAIATGVIAWATVRSYALHSRQADLAQAIVVATVVTGAGQADHAVPRLIERFKEHYTAKTPIFPRNKDA